MTEKMNLKGLASVTAIMAAISNKPMHVSGGYRW